MPHNCEGKYGHLFVQDLQLPADISTPEAQAAYAKFGQRILWLDSDVVPGAFQINTAWWFKGTPREERKLSKPIEEMGHSHPNPEVLAFIGTDSAHPNELGGEAELYIDGEQHILTKSTLVYIPPNLHHTPLFINRVDHPIIHFSVLLSEHYSYVKDGKEIFGNLHAIPAGENKAND